MRYVVRGWIMALLSVAWIGSSGLAVAGEATTFIKTTTEAVLGIFEDPQWQGPEQQGERQARLRQLANDAFDWQEIARRALATHWRDRTPQQQQEFVQLFRDLVERAYLNRLEEAVAQKQDIQYVDEQGDDSRAVVKVKVVTKRNQVVPFEYRVHKANGKWQIYDAAFEGVSLISNYRSQFNQIIASASYDVLIQKMKAKVEGVSAGPPRKRQ